MHITESQLRFLIQEVIKKVGNKYVLYPKKGGKRLGTHSSKKAAQKQDAAIQISKSMGENNEIDEFKKYKGKGSNPCWPGYRPGGKKGSPKTKIGKSGKRVANCQKINEADPKVGTGKKPKGSGRRLYTDENPKDTVSIKYASVADARSTCAKVKKVNKSYARKIQILTVGEQRAKVMGKSQVVSIFKRGKDAIRKTNKKRRT